MSNERPTASDTPGPDERTTAEAIAGLPAVPVREISHPPGTMIGAYKVLEVLGEGGFGVVYLAEQTQPVRRRVALKIIKPGMDSQAIVARFEAERQALALMSHPNIAKVLDAGTTPLDLPGGDRPYFVMEHIKGTPITEYCDTHRLTVEQRLKLFGVVCEAVQHAHMKGIIHRDLKPSNILVTEGDQGEARPVVIDFGIAKALSDPLTEQTIFTARGMLIGTPEYMSPEQADNTEKDIDTRSDVYSLGVVLYELLTGALPFDSKTLRAAGVAAIQKMLREVDPPRPSTRLSTMGAGAAGAAMVRGMEQSDLAAMLRRELEWIPLKALRKDRSERYRSASELADDVANYLAHRPLMAGPESQGYRARKFVRRNKGAVAAAGVIAATLVVATGVSVWFALSEAEQRREAVRQRGLAETNAASEAKALKRVLAINEFVTAALVSGDPVAGGSIDTTIVQAMDNATKQIESRRFEDDPELEASLLSTIGAIYLNNGRYPESKRVLERALEIHQRLFKDDDPNLGNILNGLADVYSTLGEYAQAEPLYTRALAIRERALGPDDADVATSLSNLATLSTAQGNFEKALPQYVRALEIMERARGRYHPDVAALVNNLSEQYRLLGQYDQAEPLYVRAIAILERTSGGDHPNFATMLNNLAQLYTMQGRLDEAEPLYKRSLAIRERVLGPDHFDVGASLINLGGLYYAQGNYDQAAPLFARSLAINEKALGPDHRQVALVLNNMATLARAQGRHAEAEALFMRSLAINEKSLGPDHPDVAASLTNLARTLQLLGKTDEARQMFDRAVDIHRRLSPTGSADLARTLWRSGSARLENNDAAALPELEEAVAMAEKFLKPDDKQLKEYRETLATCKPAIPPPISPLSPAAPTPPKPPGGG